MKNLKQIKRKIYRAIMAKLIFNMVFWKNSGEIWENFRMYKSCNNYKELLKINNRINTLEKRTTYLMKVFKRWRLL